MHITRVYILLLSYICMIIAGTCWFSPVDLQIDRQEIGRYVRNTQSDTAAYTDLLLRLSKHRIVLLGEQTHYDGGTLTYKKQLVKALHERFGYDVVLYEASLYDMWHINNETPLQPEKGLYYFWCSNKESRPVWKFYEDSRQTASPVTLGGFDVRYSGNVPDSVRLKNLEAYLHTKNIDIQKYADFVRLHSHIKYLFMNPSVLDSLQTTCLLSDIDRMATSVKSSMEPDDPTDELHYRYLQGLKAYLEACTQYKPGETYRMQLRDSLMADNFKWLVDTVYKDKKIIVWCSNLHALYESSRLNDFKPFGSYLKECFGNEVISAVFSSYARISDDGITFRRLSRRSLEYQIHACGIAEGYLDFFRPDTASWLKRQFVSGINQGLSIEADWSKKTDLLIYIDKMTKPTY